MKRIGSEWTVLRTGSRRGRFYVFRNVALVDACGSKRTFSEYMHTDFVAHEGISHGDQYSGYFDSQADALAAIEIYNKQVTAESDQ